MQEEKMNVSKDAKITQYASTITGLSEFHLMRDTLEEVFGEGELIDFGNVEDMKQVIIDTYSKKEYQFVTRGDLAHENQEKANGEDDKEEEKEDKNIQGKFSAEEITKHLSKLLNLKFCVEKGEIYTQEGEWRRPPNKNKRCYCKSG